ncbi:MFS transporter [Sporosarcina sp. Te-1]|uniref:MFS transporter n=1 Tax=Sporosarcina sp. Te-1 TaxID=2818390 RepID=UPI001A9F8759|nr:MFS transporter [Sporosarcina sp. Te-1]QTD42549.1 MFS transporter [Sporosarcina sp. Te-1]
MKHVIEEDTLWRNRNFLLLWGGSTLSSFGMQMYSIAIPLLIYDLSQSALAMSMMRAIEFFPNIFLGMLAGVLVDRLNRKRMMVWTSFIQVLSMAAVLALLMTKQLEIWHLYIIGFVLSSAGYTFGNANHSVLPQLISKEQLTSANAKLSLVDTLIRMIGPGIAGMLIAAFSYESTLTIYFGCLFLLFVFIQFLQVPSRVRETNRTASLWKDMKEGIDELLHNQTLLTPTVTVLFSNFASSLVIGVLVFFATDELGANSEEVGFMFTISAIGGIIGASVVGKLRKRYGRGTIYTYSLLFDILAMALLIFTQTWWMIGISLAIRTFSTTLSNIVYFTIRQEFTPNHLLGRVAGTSSMLMKLTLPFGLFISGLWAEWFSIRILFVGSMCIFILLFLRLFHHPFRKLK